MHQKQKKNTKKNSLKAKYEIVTVQVSLVMKVEIISNLCMCICFYAHVYKMRKRKGNNFQRIKGTTSSLTYLFFRMIENQQLIENK